MADEKPKTTHDHARGFLNELQEFDVDKLPRVQELGTSLDFSGAVAPATKLISLYNKLDDGVLDDYPPGMLSQFISRAKEDISLLNSILAFTADAANPATERDGLINKLSSNYIVTFEILHPIISYSMAKTKDISELETNARRIVSDLSEISEKVKSEMSEYRNEAELALESIRNAASELGVSQQAIHFNDESKSHHEQANAWRNITVIIGFIAVLFAVISLWLHQWIPQSNTYESIQLAVSKVLIFAVLLYMLYLSGRNFLSHTHNAIVNKHRQNALLTYNAIAEAAKDLRNREVILTYAAACIFSPQPTGYTKDIATGSSNSLIGLLTKPLTGADE